MQDKVAICHPVETWGMLAYQLGSPSHGDICNLGEFPVF